MANIPIPRLANATYEQLLANARQKLFEVSGGRLNDTSEAGVLTALLKQQAAAIDAQNQILNSLPEIATLVLLRSIGIGLNPGTAARVSVTLVLNQVLTVETQIQPFRIARSGIVFQVVGNTDNGAFVVVPAGSATVEAIAVATVFGVAGNVSPGTWQILEQQTLVLSVVSGDAASGGKDPDSLATTTPEMLAEKLSAGSLTRTADFERYLRDLLGVGSVTLAIGKLGPDRSTKQLGAVHVFGLNSNGTELTKQQMQQLLLEIDKSSPLAAVYVSSMEIFKLRAFVIVVLAANANGQAVSLEIWQAMKEYVSPTNLKPGEAVYVNECVVLVGGIAGVDRVQSVAIGELEGVPQPTNQALPFPWSVPRLDSITVRCVFGRNETAFNYP